MATLTPKKAITNQDMTDQIVDDSRLAGGGKAVTQVQARYVINKFRDFALDGLRNGQPVLFGGFGLLHVVKVPTRHLKNPRTGAPITVPPRKIVRLKINATLRKGI